MKAFSSQTIFSGTIINIGSRSLARLLRLLLLVVISLKFGASYETDAYFIAQSVVLLFLFLGDSVLNFTFLPVFVDHRKNRGEAEAWPIANTTFTFVGVCLLLISLAIFLFAPYVARVLAPGFSDKALALTTLLIRIISPVPLLAGIASVPAAVFYSYRSFITPAITALFYGSGAIIFALLLSDKLGIISILIGSVAGVGLQALVLIVILKKKRREFKLSSDIHPGVKQVIKLTGPRLLGFTLGRINLIIDRIFASGLGVGYVSCLTYAYRLFQIPSAILISAFAKTFMPLLCEYGAAGDQEEIRKFISKSIRLVAFATIPIAILLFIFRTPLISFLFQRGAFDASDTYLTSSAFLFYDVGLVALCLNIILLGVFYALQDAATPLRIALINAVLNVVLDLILIRWLGLAGIALATSLIAIFNTILILGLLRKRIGGLDGRKIVSSLLRISGASAIMGFVLWLILYNFDSLYRFGNQVLELGTLFLIAFMTYSVACMVLKVNEFKRVVTLLRRKLAF